MSQSVHVRPSSIDDFIETYVCWREACDAVWMGYAQWLRAPQPERAVAFAAYEAALDREDLAAHAHRGALCGIDHGDGRRP
jgi:hypothetical protein